MGQVRACSAIMGHVGNEQQKEQQWQSLMSKLRRILKSFFNSNIERFPSSSTFCTWDRYDNPDTVILEWCYSLNHNVSESLDAILLRHDISLHD